MTLTKYVFFSHDPELAGKEFDAVFITFDEHGFIKHELHENLIKFPDSFTDDE